jgi:hypothetical protein
MKRNIFKVGLVSGSQNHFHLCLSFNDYSSMQITNHQQLKYMVHYYLHSKMKCSYCLEQNLRSTIHVQGGSTTLMTPTIYWDEDGKSHFHDLNINTSKYSCSNRHCWIVRRRQQCLCCNAVTTFEQVTRESDIPLVTISGISPNGAIVSELTGNIIYQIAGTSSNETIVSGIVEST